MSGKNCDSCCCSNKIKPAARVDNPRTKCGSSNCPNKIGDSTESDDPPSPPRKGCDKASCPKRAKPKDPDDLEQGKEKKPKGCDLASCLKRNQPDRELVVNDEKTQPDGNKPEEMEQTGPAEETNVPEEVDVAEQPTEEVEEQPPSSGETDATAEAEAQIEEEAPAEEQAPETEAATEAESPVDAEAPTTTETPAEAGVPKVTKGCKNSTCPKRKPSPKPKRSRCSCKSKSSDNLKSPRSSRVGATTSNPQVKKPVEDDGPSDTDSFCSCKSKSPDRRRRRSASAEEDAYCSCNADRTPSPPKVRPCRNSRCPAKKVTYCTNDEGDANDDESPEPIVKVCENVRCRAKKPSLKNVYCGEEERREDKCCSCRVPAAPMKKKCENVRCPSKKVSYCGDDEDSRESPKPPIIKICDNVRCQSKKVPKYENNVDDEQGDVDDPCSCKSTTSPPKKKVVCVDEEVGDEDDYEEGDQDKCCSCKTRRASIATTKRICENVRCPSKKVAYCGDDEDVNVAERRRKSARSPSSSCSCKSIVDENEAGDEAIDDLVDEEVECSCGRNSRANNDRAIMSTPEVRSCGSSVKRVVICTEEVPREKRDVCECGGGRSSALCLDMATSTAKVMTSEDGTYPKNLIGTTGNAKECCSMCGCTLREEDKPANKKETATSASRTATIDSSCETSAPKLMEKCCKCEGGAKVVTTDAGGCPISITIYCGGESQSQLKSCVLAPEAGGGNSSTDSDGAQSPSEGRRGKKKRSKRTSSDCKGKGAGTTNTGAQCCCPWMAAKGGGQRGCFPVYTMESSVPKLGLTKYFGGEDATSQIKHTCCTCRSRSGTNTPNAAQRADQSTSYLQLKTCENSTCATKNSVFCDGDSPEEPKSPPNDDVEICVSEVFAVDTATSTNKVNAFVRNVLLKTDAGTCMPHIRQRHETNAATEPIASVTDRATGSALLLNHLHYTNVPAAYIGHKNQHRDATIGTSTWMPSKMSPTRSHRVQCSDEKIQEANRELFSSMNRNVQKNATLDASTEIAANLLQRSTHIARSKSRKIQCSKMSVDAGDYPGNICSNKSVRFNTVGVQKTPMADFASSFVPPQFATEIIPSKWRTEATYYYTTMDFASECTPGDLESKNDKIANQSLSTDKATNVSYLKSRRSRRKRKEQRDDDDDDNEETDVMSPVTPPSVSRNRSAKKMKSSSVQVRTATVKRVATGKSPSEVLIKCVDLENARPATSGGPSKPNSPVRKAERQGEYESTPLDETFMLCGDLEKGFEVLPGTPPASPTPQMGYRCPKHSRMGSKTENSLARPVSAPQSQSPGEQQFVSCGDLDQLPPLDEQPGFSPYRCPKHGLIVESAVTTNKSIITHMPINLPKVKSRKIQSRSREKKNQ